MIKSDWNFFVLNNPIERYPDPIIIFFAPKNVPLLCNKIKLILYLLLLANDKQEQAIANVQYWMVSLKYLQHPLVSFV